MFCILDPKHLNRESESLSISQEGIIKTLLVSSITNGISVLLFFAGGVADHVGEKRQSDRAQSAGKNMMIGAVAVSVASNFAKMVAHGLWDSQ